VRGTRHPVRGWRLHGIDDVRGAAPDLDVILLLRPEDLPPFLARFPRPDYYHDEAAALEAVRSGGQFNIIDNERGLKVDVFVAADAVSRQQIARARRLGTASGGTAMFSPPEELILMKLKYYAFGWTEKHLRDVAAMLGTPGAEIDRERVAALAAEHGVTHVWEAVLLRIARG
jgi:hypothetical protein